jgi:hypothetical protein
MKTFRRFRSEILQLISANVDFRTFLPGEAIFEAGDEGYCLYILLQGRAQAMVNGKAGYFDEGSTFGEMCLFGQVKRSMTITAVSLCICNVVHRDIITYAFRQFPEDHDRTFTDSRAAHAALPRVQGSEEKVLKQRAHFRRDSGRQKSADKMMPVAAVKPVEEVSTGDSSPQRTRATIHVSGGKHKKPSFGPLRRSRTADTLSDTNPLGSPDGGPAHSSDSNVSSDEELTEDPNAGKTIHLAKRRMSMKDGFGKT